MNAFHPITYHFSFMITILKNVQESFVDIEPCGTSSPNMYKSISMRAI
jgi:hypothetical protein